MKIIIIGAGELGRLLASTLCARRHDVVIVDSSDEELERLTDKLDVMTVAGSCCSVSVLKDAGVKGADALLAVSGDEAANILACQIARKFGVENTICRLYASDSFSEKDGIGPETFGLSKVFSAPEECASKIVAVLKNSIVLERMRFSNPSALMDVLEITQTSQLSGVRIKDIPAPELLRKIRFAALLRGHEFLIPHGDTILIPGDRVYVAGREKDLKSFLDWITPDDARKPDRVVIAGSDETSANIARSACAEGFQVRMIVKERGEGERLQEELPPQILMLCGDPTDDDVQDEAGVSAADVFISSDEDDESNILSCIIAKRKGAGKVISLTHKSEYIRIGPAMEAIDCAFSTTLVAVNTVLRLLDGGAMRIDMQLQNCNANISEFTVQENSKIRGVRLSQLRTLSSVVFALLFRDGDVLVPEGSTVLKPGDVVVAILTPDGMREIKRLFEA